jgi:ribonuclease HI
MPYTMSGSFDGACRFNGSPSAYGGAAIYFPRNKRFTETKPLPNNRYHRVTNQMAELTGLVMILEAGLRRKMELYENPYFNLHIETDSAYAIGCVTEWNEKWERNGWLNTKGLPVANKDLIQKALELIQEIEEHGQVTLHKVTREDNEEADRLANQACDEAGSMYSDSDSDSDYW